MKDVSNLLLFIAFLNNYAVVYEKEKSRNTYWGAMECVIYHWSTSALLTCQNPKPGLLFCLLTFYFGNLMM
ncbi:hypothetical protein HanRHA438_Chr10g0450561 [Helianthus annuus]|nr:hypothetical protein HanRHA438_Chr10g0450561 [Helianthus annuus]